MATFQKRGSSFQAIVRKAGHKKRTKTFKNLSTAKRWANQIEAEIERGTIPTTTSRLTFSEAADEYNKNHLAHKKSWKKEQSRICLVKRHLGYKRIQEITSRDLSEFRDLRMSKVSAYSVINELGLISRVLGYAKLDLGIVFTIPKIRKPTPPQGRTRRPTEQEIEQLHASLNPIMSNLMTLAIETGMRRSELANLPQEAINYINRTAFLNDTKNGDSRTVPLSTKAVNCLRELEGKKIPRPETITRNFQTACKQCQIVDLRWHDLRHHATSLFFERGLNMMEVASITGHKTLSMLKRYTHLRAEDLASKLG